MIKKLFQYKFVSASFWIFLSTGFLNVGNYLYHVVMARMLGVEQYGVLESAISFLYILLVPLLTIMLVTVKFTSEYKGKNEMDKVGAFYYYMRNKIFFLGIILSFFLLIFSSSIMAFLHLNSIVYIFLFVIGFIVGSFLVLGRSVLQGFSLFSRFTISSVVETVCKLVFAFLLVTFGLKAQGGFMATIIASFLSYIIILYIMNKMNFKKDLFYRREKAY